MNLETMFDLTLAIGFVAFFVAIMVRQRNVYRTYQRTQQQVLDRQAEMMGLYRESLESQKEVVRLLTVIAAAKS